MNILLKHQLAVATVLEQLARREIYVWPQANPNRVRLHTKDGRRRIRVAGRFAGTWQLEDWPDVLADDSYDTVIFADFTEPVPLLFIVPGDWFRANVKQSAADNEAAGRASRHQDIKRERVLQWLYRWDVLEDAGAQPTAS